MTATATLVAAERSPNTVRTSPSRPWILVLPAVVTVAVVAIGSAGREMWADEYVTWFATTLTWPEFWRLLGNIDIVHALYYLVMRVWTDVAGDSTLALRTPSIVGMGVAAGALALLGRRLYDTTVGVTAGLLFAAIPTVTRYAQESRSYAWVTALAVLCTLALVRLLDRPTWRRFLLYGGLLLALTYLHFVAVLVVLAHLPLLWRAVRAGGGTRLLRSWSVTVLLVAVAAAPMLREASTQAGQVDWISNDRQAVGRYPGDLFGSQPAVWVLVSLAALGVLVLWYRRPNLIAPLLGWAVLPPLICYVTYPVVHLFLAKYALFTLPAWALLAAVAVAVPIAGLRRWLLGGDTIVVLGLVVLAVAAAGLTGQLQLRHSPVAGEADFRAAADLIDQRYEPGDGLVYSGWSRPARLSLEYELRTEPRDVFAAVPARETGWFSAVECTDLAFCLGDTRRLWLIDGGPSIDPFDDLPSDRADLLRQNFTVVSTDAYPSVRVVLLAHR